MHLKCTDILAVAVLLLIVSISGSAMADYQYEPSAKRVGQISLEEARRLIEMAAHGNRTPEGHVSHTICSFYLSRETSISVWMSPITFGPDFFEFSNPLDEKGLPTKYPARFYYRDFPAVILNYEAFSLRDWDEATFMLAPKNAARLLCLVGRRSPWFEERAKDLADAFRRLQFEFDRMNSPSAEATFQQVVQRYRGANPKPEFPEDARRFRVQAESALRDKRFGDAVDSYTKALEIAPWWPAGRFNLALLLGELGSYSSAMREMKRYLQLVPDASNVRAAQDKVYEWESKTGKENY